MIDIIGYAGTAFVVLSFSMKKVVWIRIVNMIGSVLSLIYGVFMNTCPTAILNGFLLVVNTIFLILIYLDKRRKEKPL